MTKQILHDAHVRYSQWSQLLQKPCKVIVYRRWGEGVKGHGAREPDWCHLVNFHTTSHSRGESATEQRDRTQEKSLRVKNFPLSEGQRSCWGLCAREISRTALWWTVRQFFPHRVRPRGREGSGLEREPTAWTQTGEGLFPSLRTFSRV